MKKHQAFCWAAVTFVSSVACGVLGHFLPFSAGFGVVLMFAMVVASLGGLVVNDPD